jgi:hypothetical protein
LSRILDAKMELAAMNDRSNRQHTIYWENCLKISLILLKNYVFNHLSWLNKI